VRDPRDPEAVSDCFFMSLEAYHINGYSYMPGYLVYLPVVIDHHFYVLSET
jgi:hypothetical protein